MSFLFKGSDPGSIVHVLISLRIRGHSSTTPYLTRIHLYMRTVCLCGVGSRCGTEATPRLTISGAAASSDFFYVPFGGARQRARPANSRSVVTTPLSPKPHRRPTSVPSASPPASSSTRLGGTDRVMGLACTLVLFMAGISLYLFSVGAQAALVDLGWRWASTISHKRD